MSGGEGARGGGGDGELNEEEYRLPLLNNDDDVVNVESNGTGGNDNDNNNDVQWQHNDDGATTMTTFWEEARILILDLAIPQTMLQLGLIFSSALTAAYVGRTMGSLYLDGFTLGNLTGNLFITSLLQGLLSASDTLSPQAFGAGNPRELGLLAIRGTVASWMIIIPIIAVLWTTLEHIFVALDQDPEVARLAAHWFQVFCLGLPSYSISMMMWRFLAAQNLMHPQVVVGLASQFLVLPACLYWFTKWMGFLGSAAAITCYSIVYTSLLWLYLWYYQPHVPESWPGFGCWREALESEKVKEFLKLGLGGMLCFVEWIYWEVLVLMAGTFGVVPLSVQTICNMIIEVCAMWPTGLGIAISIRIGNTLGATNIKRAQWISIWSLLIGTLVFAVLSLLLYMVRHLVISLFTKESDVVEGCQSIWFKVCCLHFNVGIYGIVMGIATGLGMQWTLGIASCIILFGVGLPASYHFAIQHQGGLDQIWFWMNPPYMLINVALILCFLRTSWSAIANAITERQQQQPQQQAIMDEELAVVPADGNHHHDEEHLDGGPGCCDAAIAEEETPSSSLTQPLIPSAAFGKEQA